MELAIFMIEFLLLAVLFVIAYFYYAYVHKPKQLYDYYALTFQKLGYRVLKLPFKPFCVPFKLRYQDSFAKHRDSFYFDKHMDQTYDLVLHNIIDHVTIDLVNPDMIREFLSMDKIFLFPKTNIYIANIKRLLGHGVTFSEGSAWKTKRKIVTSVFTFDFLQSIIPNISQICDRQLDKIESEWASQGGMQHQIKFYMFQLGFNIFSNVLMASFFGMDANKFKIQGKSPCQFINQALILSNSQATEPLGYLLGPWIFKFGLNKRDRQVNESIKTFRRFATELVKEKIQSIQADKKEGKQKIYRDLIEALVHSYNLGSDEQQKDEKYTINDVIDEFCTLFAAGTDTTTHFFMMMVYYIVQNPIIQERLRTQIDQIFHTEQDFTWDNLKKIKYIDCIQDQVNRIYGPTNGVFLREAVQDTQILNIPILKDTSVSLKPMLNHYNSQFFQDPLSFKPERWEKPNNLHPYTLWNFSAGPRSCLGKHLALLETKIALIKLFKRFKTIKLQKSKEEWEMEFQFLYSPKKFMTIFKH